MIIDNFLDSYDDLKEHSLSCEFSDVVNPKDGVTYPLICQNIPTHIETAVMDKLAYVTGLSIKDYTMFMRQSPEGVHCPRPHAIHNDASMGKFSFMLYLNNGDGGTGFFRHRESGITYAPENPEYVEILKKDQLNTGAWVETHRVPMKENRGVIFDSGKMHAALPFGGSGVNENARTVLTVFFT